LIGGSIVVQPYRMGLETPCARCEYRSVCRFDPAINHYLHLPAMKRADVLEMVTTKGAADGG
jgi:ATP-dependent helicase/nuclease subunit B